MCVVVHNYVYTIEFASVYIFLFACRCGCMCTMYGGVRIMFVCSYVHVCMSKECVYVHIISVFIYISVHVTGSLGIMCVVYVYKMSVRAHDVVCGDVCVCGWCTVYACVCV